MKNKRILVFLSLVAGVLMACNLPSLAQRAIAPATNTPPPTAIAISTTPPTQEPTITPQSPAACLVGTWKMADLGPYVQSAIPPDMVDQYQLKYQDSEGSADIIFGQDGQATFQANQLVLHFTAKASILTIPLNLNLNGKAAGQYQADSTTVTTQNMDTSQLDASAQSMGQDLVDRQTILSAIPLLEPPANQAQYTCSGDVLELTVNSYPSNIPPLKFTREK